MKVPRDGMNLVLIRAVPVRESCAKSSASSPVLHSDTTLDKGIEHIQFVSKGLQSQIQKYQKEAARLGRSENRATLAGSFSISRTYGSALEFDQPGANSVGGVGLLYDHYEQTSDGRAVSATSNDLAFGNE
jgi:hypothetical protein